MRLSQQGVLAAQAAARKLGINTTPEIIQRIVEAGTPGDLLGPRLRDLVEFLRSSVDINTISDADADAIVAEADELFPVKVEDPWTALANKLRGMGQLDAAKEVERTVGAVKKSGK